MKTVRWQQMGERCCNWLNEIVKSIWWRTRQRQMCRSVGYKRGDRMQRGRKHEILRVHVSHHLQTPKRCLRVIKTHPQRKKWMSIKILKLLSQLVVYSPLRNNDQHVNILPSFDWNNIHLNMQHFYAKRWASKNAPLAVFSSFFKSFKVLAKPPGAGGVLFFFRRQSGLKSKPHKSKENKLCKQKHFQNFFLM